MVKALAIALFFLTSQLPQHPATLADVRQRTTERYGRIRFHREEQFEDRLTLGILDEDLNIYRLEPAPDPACSGCIPDPIPTLYVAYAKKKDHAFGLAGFPDAEGNFARLLSELPPVRINSSTRAEARALLCAEIVYGLSPKWWLDGKSSLKLQSAEYFLSKGYSDGLLRANQWSSTVQENADFISIKSARVSDGFRVSLPVFWGPVEGDSSPMVKLYLFHVSESGGCKLEAAPSTVVGKQ